MSDRPDDGNFLAGSASKIWVGALLGLMYACGLPCTGCAEKSAQTASASIPVSDPAAAPDSNGEKATADDPRELAAAEPESVIGKTADRDIFFRFGAPAPQRLTRDALGETLFSMGLNPEDGGNAWIVRLKATTSDQRQWEYPIRFIVSRDQTVVWISCPITQLNETRATDLLVANYRLGTFFFAADQKHNLLMQHPIDNIGITGAVLNWHLGRFLATLKMTEPLYSGLVGGPAGGGAMPAPKDPFD